jgi:hypothetical protein
MEVSIMNQKDIIDRPLELDIKPNDSKLLIIIKEALKGYTTVKFRKLFSDDEDTEYENMLRVIEKPPRGRITAARYLMFIERINMFNNASSVMKKYNITKRSVK